MVCTQYHQLNRHLFQISRNEKCHYTMTFKIRLKRIRPQEHAKRKSDSFFVVSSTSGSQLDPAEIVTTRPVNRNGGRHAAPLPAGSMMVTDEGYKKYVCQCNTTFSKKGNLERHQRSCTLNASITSVSTRRKNKVLPQHIGSPSIPYVEPEVDESIPQPTGVKYVCEDASACRLLECKCSSIKDTAEYAKRIIVGLN